MQTILILGASGFIGQALTDKLIGKYNIIAIDRVSNNMQDKTNYRFSQEDFTKMDNFDELLLGVDKVVHLISTTVPNDSTDYIIEELQKNIVPTIHLLNSMVKMGVKEIIFASSAGTVYGESDKINFVDDAKNPICSYGIKKSVIEDYIKLYERYHGIVGKIARFSNPYGVGQNSNKQQGVIPIFIRKIFEQEPISIFGDTYRDYIYIDDLVDGLLKTIDYDGEHRTFQICVGKSYHLSHIIDSIERISGKTFLEVKYCNCRVCDVKDNFLDASETNYILDWSAKVDLHEGITNVIQNMNLI